MFKKFARWILQDDIDAMDRDLLKEVRELAKVRMELAEESLKLDIARAQAEAANARFDELMADHIRADLTIHKVKEATEGIKQGTAMKVHRIVSQYYDAS